MFPGPVPRNSDAIIRADAAPLSAVSAKKRKKEAVKRKKGGGTARAGIRQVTRAQLPRPRVTEFNAVTVVPVFPGGEAGPPSGSPGPYDIVFVLGVPGVSSVTTSLDFESILAGGDSLLQGSGRQVDLESSDGQSLHAARIGPQLAQPSGPARSGTIWARSSVWA
jgi:hypothetical protein